jgi:AcrR family transcriptional regulator
MRPSTKSRPRTKPPEERRDELMNSAQHLFLKSGVGPTTIEQITSGAKVAKGTFYLYFSSKEAVLAALGDRFAEEHLSLEGLGEYWRHSNGK